MAPILLVTFGLFVVFANSQTLIECTDSFECENTAISESQVACSGDNACKNTTIVSGDTDGYINCTAHASCSLSDNLSAARNLYCRGYKSCYDASSQSGRVIQCAGSQSCAKTSRESISANALLYCGAEKSCFGALLRSNKRVYCEGKASCVRASITSGENVNCGGKYSCHQSGITATTSVLCGGELSCKSAIITASQSVRLYGAYSGERAKITDTPLIEGFGDSVLYKTLIDSGSLLEMTVKLFNEEWFYGTQSKVICRSGATCNLLCKGGGCASLNYVCEPGSVCNLNPNGCLVNQGSVHKGIKCPKITNGSSVAVYFDDTDGEANMYHDYDRYHQPEDEEDIDLDDDSEYQLSADATQCTMENQCVGQVISDTDVNCGGLDSCSNAQLTTTNTGSIVGCYGEDSCNSATISSLNGNALCLGEKSCELSSITSDRVRCLGLKSCESAVSIEAGGDVLCGGTASCKLATIAHSKTDANCTANRACYESTIIASRDIDCDGHYSCSTAELTANRFVDCGATGGCHGATIYPGNHLYVSGFYGAYGASIYPGNAIIKGLGYHSLSFSVIDSVDTNRMIVALYAHLAGYKTTVICRAHSECTVICTTSGCKNLDYIAVDGAVRNVRPAQCNSPNITIWKGIDCPIMSNEIANDEIDQIMKRKQYDIQNDEIYKKFNREIMNDDLEFDSLELLMIDDDDMNDEDINDDEEELFGEVGIVQRVLSSHKLLIISGIIGIVSVMMIIVFYVCYKERSKEYQPLK